MLRWADGCGAGLVTFYRWSGVIAGCLSGSFVDAHVWAGRGWCAATRPGIGLGVRRWGWQGPEADGRRLGVAGAGGLAGFLDLVAVVAGAFDRAGATAMPATRVEPAGDLGVYGR